MQSPTPVKKSTIAKIIINKFHKYRQEQHLCRSNKIADQYLFELKNYNSISAISCQSSTLLCRPLSANAL